MTFNEILGLNSRTTSLKQLINFGVNCANLFSNMLDFNSLLIMSLLDIGVVHRKLIVKLVYNFRGHIVRIGPLKHLLLYHKNLMSLSFFKTVKYFHEVVYDQNCLSIYLSLSLVAESSLHNI